MSQTSSGKALTADRLGPAFGFSYKPDSELQVALASDDEELIERISDPSEDCFTLYETGINAIDDIAKMHPGFQVYVWGSKIANISGQNNNATLDFQTMPGTKINAEKRLQFSMDMLIADYDDARASLPGVRSLFVKSLFAVKQSRASLGPVSLLAGYTVAGMLSCPGSRASCHPINGHLLRLT
jgi:hypothetical protein